MQTRWLPVSLATALLLSVGVAHGLMTDRWANSIDRAEIVRGQLESLPAQLGPWRADEWTTERDKTERVTTFTRRYHSDKGRTVVVALSYGKPGYVAVHTPELCYPSSGFVQQGGISHHERASGLFWEGTFQRKRQTNSEAVRVRWTWTDNGKWLAPDWPRWVYARSPELFKLYVIHPDGSDEALYDDFIDRLLKDLSPKLFGG